MNFCYVAVLLGLLDAILIGVASLACGAALTSD